jgi:hypothetical protein
METTVENAQKPFKKSEKVEKPQEKVAKLSETATFLLASLNKQEAGASKERNCEKLRAKIVFYRNRRELAVLEQTSKLRRAGLNEGDARKAAQHNVTLYQEEMIACEELLKHLGE